MRKELSSLAVAGALALLALLLGAGCQQDKSASPAESGTGEASTTGSTMSGTSSGPRSTPSTYDRTGSSQMTTATDGSSRAVQGAVDTTGRAAEGTADTTGRAVQGAADSTGRAAEGAAAEVDATAAEAGARTSDAAAGATDATTQQAQKLLDQATQYIKENKFELADQTLTQLEQLKPKLPASFASKIDSTRKLLNTARSGSGLLGGGTK